jgi:hypothetical protein
LIGLPWHVLEPLQGTLGSEVGLAITLEADSLHVIEAGVLA